MNSSEVNDKTSNYTVWLNAHIHLLSMQKEIPVYRCHLIQNYRSLKSYQHQNNRLSKLATFQTLKLLNKFYLAQNCWKTWVLVFVPKDLYWNVKKCMIYNVPLFSNWAKINYNQKIPGPCNGAITFLFSFAKCLTQRKNGFSWIVFFFVPGLKCQCFFLKGSM